MSANTHYSHPRFWFVWTKTGQPPKYAHSTRAEAEKEACRLARKHPGKKFIVLESKVKIWVDEREVAGEMTQPDLPLVERADMQPAEPLT